MISSLTSVYINSRWIDPTMENIFFITRQCSFVDIQFDVYLVKVSGIRYVVLLVNQQYLLLF